MVEFTEEWVYWEGPIDGVYVTYWAWEDGSSSRDEEKEACLISQ